MEVESLSEAVGILARRGRISSVLVITTGVAVALALVILESFESIFILAAIVVSISLLFAWAPWSGSKEIEKAREVLAPVDLFVVASIKGFYWLRLYGSLAASEVGHPSAALRFSTSLASEGGGEAATFRLVMPWELPIELAVLPNRSRSDAQAVAGLLERLRGTLGRGDYLMTDIAKRRLESAVVPGWGRWRKPDETPESIRNRLLARSRDMGSLVRLASEDRRFEPL